MLAQRRDIAVGGGAAGQFRDQVHHVTVLHAAADRALVAAVEYASLRLITLGLALALARQPALLVLEVGRVLENPAGAARLPDQLTQALVVDIGHAVATELEEPQIIRELVGEPDDGRDPAVEHEHRDVDVLLDHRSEDLGAGPAMDRKDDDVGVGFLDCRDGRAISSGAIW